MGERFRRIDDANSPVARAAGQLVGLGETIREALEEGILEKEEDGANAVEGDRFLAGGPKLHAEASLGMVAPDPGEQRVVLLGPITSEVDSGTPVHAVTDDQEHLFLGAT